MSLLIAAVITVVGVAIFASLTFGPQADCWCEETYERNDACLDCVKWEDEV